MQYPQPRSEGNVPHAATEQTTAFWNPFGTHIFPLLFDRENLFGHGERMAERRFRFAFGGDHLRDSEQMRQLDCLDDLMRLITVRAGGVQ